MDRERERGVCYTQVHVALCCCSRLSLYVDFSAWTEQKFMSASIKIELPIRPSVCPSACPSACLLMLQIMYVFWHAGPWPGAKNLAEGSRGTRYRDVHTKTCIVTCAKLKCATFACLINEMFDNLACLSLSLSRCVLVSWSHPVCSSDSFSGSAGVCGRSALMECSLWTTNTSTHMWVTVCVCQYVCACVCDL